MTSSAECCGWASWGELAGMGDGRVRVEVWDQRGAGAAGAEVGGASSSDASQTDAAAHGVRTVRYSGRRARAAMAISRWRLAERNKRR
jgi:hypothetical protein